ncbi:MAG TPA: hypothetical protein VJH95_01945 [Candidatus Nanoarchaeia archaeon]|nr:hypothetical protein [Candidatus Nanoarchaeia archaeon]
MASVEDIPRYIRYDFFMALFGIIIAYFAFTNERVYNTTEIRWLFLIISSTTILYGIFEMKNNYDKDKELQEERRKLEQLRIDKALKSLEKKL